jgi:hypothetical protein
VLTCCTGTKVLAYWYKSTNTDTCGSAGAVAATATTTNALHSATPSSPAATNKTKSASDNLRGEARATLYPIYSKNIKKKHKKI